MKVYSPSQTERWSTCPVLWAEEYKKGWRPGKLGKREVAGIQGTAFSAGMAVYNLQRKNGWPLDNFPIIHEATTTAERMLVDLRKHGFDLSILSEYGDLNATLAEAIEKYIKQDPTPPDWQVVAVEEPRTDHGYARCDVVYRRPDHGRVVRDYKYTQAIDKKYVPQRLRDYAEAGQRHHYLWMEEADTFIVTLVVANPFKVYEQPFVLDKDRQEEWLRSSRVKWDLMERMEKGELPLFEAESHVTKYGRGDSAQCVLYEWCLEYHRDPKALEVLGFIQIERTTNAPRTNPTH